MASKVMPEAVSTAKIKTTHKTMDSFTKLWSNVFLNTSLHGCRNILDTEKTRPIRLLWMVATLAMLCGVLYFLTQSLLDYYKFETMTVYRSESRAILPFPKVTVCNIGSYDMANGIVSDTLRNYFLRLSDFGFFLNNDQNQSKDKHNFFLYNDLNQDQDDLLNTSFIDFHNQFSYRKDRFITYADFNKMNVTSAFEAVETDVGRCFEFNGQNSIKERGRFKPLGEGRSYGLTMHLNIRQDSHFVSGGVEAGVKIVIQEPHEFPRVYEEFTFLAPGTASSIALKPKKFKFLPEPYKSYGGRNCLDMHANYSYYACLRKIVSNVTVHHCNCRAPVDTDFTSFPECTFLQITECYIIKSSITSHQAYTGQVGKIECPRPCQFVHYQMEMSSASYPSNAGKDYLKAKLNISPEYVRNNLVKVSIYYEKFIEEFIEYVPKYSPMGILGNIGGQMGFFLGASLLTLAEFAEAVIYCCGILFKKCIIQKKT